MRLTESQRALGKEQARINAERRRQGLLPPLPKIADFRAAIRWKCVECMGGGEPLPQADIRRCSSGPDSRSPCPLWPYRPWQLGE